MHDEHVAASSRSDEITHPRPYSGSFDHLRSVILKDEAEVFAVGKAANLIFERVA
jgi:hypothetical protein